MQTTIYSVYIYDYICISPYININSRNEWEQYGGPADVILSFSMRLYRYIYTIAIYRPHLQEFTGKIWQFCHVFILPITTMKCGWRSQRCITPKKGNPAILGNWQEKIQASGLGQTKKCPWWNVLQEGHLSPSKDLSPASASFPCCHRSSARLFMDWSVSGWFAPRCASRPARARRCRASAWRLGMMASVVWGPRPGSACEYYVTMWERKKDEQWLCVWIDEKDVKYNCAM